MKRKYLIIFLIFICILIINFFLIKKYKNRVKKLKNQLIITEDLNVINSKNQNKYRLLFNRIIKSNFQNLDYILEKKSVSLNNINFSIYRIMNDETLDYVLASILQGNEAEYKMLDNIEFQKNDYLLDIGAHYGSVSLYFAKKNPNLKIISLEPSKILSHIFKKSIAENNISNINLINSGIGNSNYITKFNFDISNTWGSTNTENGCFDKEQSLSEEVNLITFQNLKKKFKLNKIKALKIDCEGCEYDFFENLTDKDLKNIEYIAIEVHPWLDNYKERWNKIEKKIFQNIKKENVQIIYWGGVERYKLN